jgi:hypothetical protein
MVTILAVLVVGGGGAYAAKKLKLKNNSVTTRKIRDGAVTGPKVADKSLDAADLSDSVLSDRSVGRMDNSPGTCSPTAGGVACVDVVVPMPRPGRVLVNADGGALYATNDLVIGACQLTADGSGISFGVPLAGDGVSGGVNSNTSDHFSLTGVTGVLPAGNHTFALFCTETSTELSILDSHLSAVSLSAD